MFLQRGPAWPQPRRNKIVLRAAQYRTSTVPVRTYYRYTQTTKRYVRTVLYVYTGRWYSSSRQPRNRRQKGCIILQPYSKYQYVRYVRGIAVYARRRTKRTTYVPVRYRYCITRREGRQTRRTARNIRLASFLACTVYQLVVHRYGTVPVLQIVYFIDLRFDKSNQYLLRACSVGMQQILANYITLT